MKRATKYAHNAAKDISGLINIKNAGNVVIVTLMMTRMYGQVAKLSKVVDRE